jgi:hypothetical protein
MTEQSIPNEIPHTSDAVQAVIPGLAGKVELFDGEGKAIYVTAEDAPYWLARGFSTDFADVPARLAETRALLQAGGLALDAFAATPDLPTFMAADMALSLLVRAWSGLHRAYTVANPPAEAAPVLMLETVTGPDGSTSERQHSIDPGQVELYQSQGLKVAA